MSAQEQIRQLQAELEADFQFIQENARKNREMTGRIDRNPDADEYDYAALGYTLHNLYNAFEAYFLRVAKFFENNLDEVGWHKSLVDRMTLEIQGVRQSLFDRQFAVRVDELLRFRHAFRNLYKAPLVPQKVRFANQVASRIDSDFEQYHQGFVRFLEDLILNTLD
ncbi:MAG: hypothetical protein EA427_11590 [Spirochaetaceae bacterium]|nr:MAG: hypothetical protein EA427_11590 [Spirochaetaceae bacterium]